MASADNILKSLKKYNGDIEFRSDALSAFLQMKEAAKNDGIDLDIVNNSFRSPEGVSETSYSSFNQNATFGTYNIAGKYMSEHHVGLAIDFSPVVSRQAVPHGTEEGPPFIEKRRKEYQWLRENAYKYGFIERFTMNNRLYTGYIEKPWHWRYVGVEITTEYFKKQYSSYEKYYCEKN